jgi:hypothetical protein
MTNPPDAAFARLERHLGWLLISGVAVSAALLSLGLLLLILSPNQKPACDPSSTPSTADAA